MSIYEDIASLSEDIVQGRLKASDGEIVTRLTGIAVKVDLCDTSVLELHTEVGSNPKEYVREKLNQIREELY